VDKKTKASEKEAFRLIEEMLHLMESRGLVELEMDHQGLRIRLKRAIGGAPQAVEYVSGVQQPVGVPAVSAPAGAQAQATAEDASRVIIKSPMVGSFYRAPSPDAPPFVEVGQDLESGQVVCIIEAMKLMNEIKAEVSGRVIEILAQNGDPVEFGQPLLAVEPKS